MVSFQSRMFGSFGTFTFYTDGPPKDVVKVLSRQSLQLRNAAARWLNGGKYQNASHLKIPELLYKNMGGYRRQIGGRVRVNVFLLC